MQRGCCWLWGGLLAALSSPPAAANHAYNGLDLCALYPEVMPPGLPAQLLPDATHPGAALMQQYCSQCHALPGPGHHTASEWEPVLANMVLLMTVAKQFGGLMGRVEAPSPEAQQQLQSYLTLHALKPLLQMPTGVGAAAFATHCGACHAVPDMSQYRHYAWPELLTRMQHNMQVMRYPLPSKPALLQIQYYLQDYLPGSLPVAASAASQPKTSAYSALGRSRWWALGPFLVLVLVSLGRWYWRVRREA